MTRVTQLIKDYQTAKLLGTHKSGVANFFEEHPDEVFRKVEVVEFFKGQINPNTVRVHINNLAHARVIGKAIVGSRPYYGSLGAIRKLNEGLKQ
jgi:hypothetical protein